MEWLSHSQKKYCELCKTPFRFTKLYHPHMPNRIPTSVFIRRAAVHVLKMLVTWCRALLVGSVWLIMLPYCMRIVWRSLFWVGDGGFLRDLYVGTDSIIDTSSSQSVALNVESSGQNSNNSAILPLPNLLMPFSRPFNMTSGDSTISAMLKRLLFGVPFATNAPSPLSTQTPGQNITVSPLGTRNPSLLSGVTFFNWFPSQAANRFFIDVMEGQIITILVVVAFILIFLIREWVVQQQPVINMVAIHEDAADHVAPEPLVAELVHDHDGHDHEDEDEDELALEHEAEVEAENEDEEEDGDEDEDQPSEQERSHPDTDEDNDTDASIVDGSGREHSAPRFHMTPALIEQWNLENQRRQEQEDKNDEKEKEKEKVSGDDFQSQVTTQDEHPESPAADSPATASSSFPSRSSSLPRHPKTHNIDDTESSNQLQRPNMPARDRSFIATEIRRSMEEREAWSFDAVSEISNDRPKDQNQDNIPAQPWEHDEPDNDLSTHTVVNTVQEQAGSENSSESWQQVPDIIVDDVSAESHTTEEKGKAKTSENTDESSNDSQRSSQSEGIGLRSISNGDIHLHEFGEHVELEIPEESPNFQRDLHMGETDVNETASTADADADAESNSAASNNLGEQDSQPGIGREQVPEAEQPPRPWLGAALDWLFDDIPPTVNAVEDNHNDEHIVQDLAAEAPFVPFAGNDPIEPVNAPVLDQEVANAAARAGIDLNDQDAIDDAEDLEGIMELIGMQGPLTGLFQNAMFSAVLISATLASAIWIPYLCGKFVILLAGSPVSVFVKLPVRLVAALCDIIVDTSLCVAAGAVYWFVKFLSLITSTLIMNGSPGYVQSTLDSISGPSRSVAESAMDRIGQLVHNSPIIPNQDAFRLSVNSHVALRSIQNSTSYAYNETSNAIVALYGSVAAGASSETIISMFRQLPTLFQGIIQSISSQFSILVSWLWTAKSYNITLGSNTVDNFMAVQSAPDPWTANDRLIAIFAGYTFFAMIGALYLKKGTPFSSSQQGKKIEGVVAEILQQAGGVLKVILIISIEMLVFPLYCGLLLDFALLPLFENATVYTRWQWTRQNPWTSGFVHWFIGTCYMFHFALFVSMCRKIMRRGVLYFIRDPDDPTFHPVRDVLERSVTTQLRKIAFSGLVYGGLVLVCLGGVVMGLNSATTGVLPIQWSSHAPSVEFPMDLLFYNFLTPLIIKVYKPSDGLQTIYKWWFKTCAHILRLSHFLFGVENKNEEGYHKKRSWFSWRGWSKTDRTNSSSTIATENEDTHSDVEESAEVDSDFVFDGRYVRAPASDQVRIPKGQRVFVEVDENNERLDGNQHEGGVHNTDMVSMVYVPPWFRVRIALFVFTIWVFAAVTGIGITVTPLLFGRYLFSLFLPSAAQMNDIHAFSLGIYTLGAMAYSIYHLYTFIISIAQPLHSPLSTLLAFATSASKLGLRILRFTYVWSSFVFFFPFMFALLLELYLLMPLHAYLGPKEPHVIHIIQDWTLGFLYARLAARVAFSNRRSRAARAFNAVVSDGYFDPNARVATRCFVIPVLAIFTMAVAVPASVAFILNNTVWAGAEQVTRNQVWRFSFPLLGLIVGTIWLGREGVGVLNKWRMVVRDEVYLIGERLHNFGERRPAHVLHTADAKN